MWKKKKYIFEDIENEKWRLNAMNKIKWNISCSRGQYSQKARVP